MDLLTFSWQLLVIALLVAANGFFVAAEFAIVKVRNAQLRPLIEKGDWRAKLAVRMLQRIDSYLSACQLGITLASIGLGWVGEPFVARWLKPLLEYAGIASPAVLHSVSFFIAYFAITYLHIVVGEQAPKMYAIQKPRRVALWVTPVLVAFHYGFLPFIWFVNASANWMLRWAGLAPVSEADSAISNDELRYHLMHSTHVHPGDELVNTIMIKALHLRETTAGQIMIPKDKVVVLWRDKPLKDNLLVAQRTGYSRYPFCGASVDEVLGVIHMKELLWQEQVLGEETILENIKRPVLTFTPITRLPAMLQLFRQSRNHMAVVVDVEDRMMGIVTFEDVLEELVGDIRDEFDAQKGPYFERTEHSVLVDADLPIRDLALEMEWPLPTKSAETIDHWCQKQWGRIPDKGEQLDIDGIRVVAEETSKRGLRRVRLIRKTKPQPR